MKTTSYFAPLILTAAALCAALSSRAAQTTANLFDKPSASSTPLFDESVVAKGKGIEIKQSQIDEAYIAYKGHRAAMGEAVPDEMRSRIEADILDKLVATQLFLQHATPEDRSKAKQIADNFIAEQKKTAPSEESFRRQLLAVGMSPEEFDKQVREQAIVKAVIDREIKATNVITEAQARKYYTDNPSLFELPEMAHVAHVVISTHDPITGKELIPEVKLEKRRLAEKILARARAGEDFAKLVKQFSQDPATKDHGGEYTFPRAKDNPRQAMVPEFEAAAFSMKPNQISDVVETSYGYHVIKLLELIPAKKIDYLQVQDRIKDNLLRDQVEKALPAFVEKLRTEAGIKIMASRYMQRGTSQ